MAQKTERSVLNHLIETCRDGERGFRYAANHLTASPVKALFTEIATQRERFAADLLPHAQRLGGESESGGTATAALHRGWMTLKDAWAGHDDQAIIREAVRGEDAAIAAYTDALNGMLPPSARDVIERQYAEVRQARDRIHDLLTH
jgi:uncharacterized protein (TIGR02284 family)